MELKKSKKLVLKAWSKVCRIPKNKWTSKIRCNEQNQMCFFGHLSNIELGDPDILDGVDLVDALTSLNFKINKDENYGLAPINNGLSSFYQQETPKERVYAFIKDVRKLKV